MFRERKVQIGADILDAVLTSTPAVLYGSYLLAPEPAPPAVLYGGLAATVLSLAVKLSLIAVRRPSIMVRVDNESEAKAMTNRDRGAILWWPESDDR